MPPASKDPPTPDRIMQLAWAYSAPFTIEAAIHNRVFDTLDSGALTIDELAKKTGASVRGLRSIANLLVAMEFLTKDSAGRYALTPESSMFLVSSKPSFKGGIFKHISKQLAPKWLQLDEIVRTGKPARAVNDVAEGEEFFQKFVEDIFPMSYDAAGVLGDELKLAAAKTPVKVLDLGCGSGVWGIALAEKSPQVRVTAVDWPGVIPVTKRVAERHHVAGRFTFVEGDIHTADFGQGHNVATLGHILHSEGAQRSKALLRRTFDALAPGGTIAIGEFVANDERTGPPNVMIFSVNMLVNTEVGDTFTFKEIESWLRTAGFDKVRSLEAPAPSPLILATKP